MIAVRLTDQGLIWRLNIFDRRWQWKYLGGLSGSYNVRFPDMGGGVIGNSLDPAFRQTPWQLAIICLTAMGEVGYDISQLPNDTYPEVNWDNEPPAKALQELVEPLGCRIVLRLDGTLMVAKTGFGLPRTLPSR